MENLQFMRKETSNAFIRSDLTLVSHTLFIGDIGKFLFTNFSKNQPLHITSLSVRLFIRTI